MKGLCQKTMTVELKTTKDGIDYLEFTSSTGYVYGSKKRWKVYAKNVFLVM